VVAHEANGAAQVVELVGVAVLGSLAVVDREPAEAGDRQQLQELPDPGDPAPGRPPAAVHDDDGGAGFPSSLKVRVERDRGAARAAIDDAAEDAGDDVVPVRIASDDSRPSGPRRSRRAAPDSGEERGEQACRHEQPGEAGRSPQGAHGPSVGRLVRERPTAGPRSRRVTVDADATPCPNGCSTWTFRQPTQSDGELRACTERFIVAAPPASVVRPRFARPRRCAASRWLPPFASCLVVAATERYPGTTTGQYPGVMTGS